MGEKAPEHISRSAAAFVLGAIVALALALRVRGLDYLLPHSTHLDATVIKNQVDALRRGVDASSTGALDEWYPYLLARLCALLPDPLATSSTLDLAGHLERASAPFLQLRWISILGALPIVVATYGLSRKFTERWAALLAAALVATSPLNISFAQQERPHAIAASFVALTVLAAMRLARRPTLGSCALVGLSASLSIGALQSGVALGFPIVVAIGFALAAPREQRPRASTVAAGAFIALGLVAAGLRLFYPFHFEGERGYLSLSEVDGGASFNISGQSVHSSHFNGAGFDTLARTLFAYLPHVALLLALGMVSEVFAARARGRAGAPLWIALAYAAPYTLVIGLHWLTWERYLMPLEPFFATFGAWGLSRALARRPRVAITAAALLTAFGLALAWRLGSVRSADDTHELAARWLAEHARESDPILAMPYLDVPLLQRDETLARRPALTWWSSYQLALTPERKLGARFDLVLPQGPKAARDEWGDDSLAHLERVGARFVLMQHVGENFRHKLAVRTREALSQHAQLRARFSPLSTDNGAMAAFGIRRHRESYSRPFFRALFEHARMGPTIEIYELPP